MEMIILIGLQRAGKSTFYRTYFAKTHELVSKDLLHTSKNRNREREGKKQVPDKAIYITAARLVRPTYAEGFDKLYTVQIRANGSFLVREWDKGIESA